MGDPLMLGEGAREKVEALVPKRPEPRDDLERITQVRLPFDRRDPCPSKNYGIHALDIWFILKGPLGAVQFAATFPCYMPHVAEEFRVDPEKPRTFDYIMPFDVGYHSPTPLYDDQEPQDKQCLFLDNKPCYYDGSGLRAVEWGKRIFGADVRGDRSPEDVLWPLLEREYAFRFEGVANGDP